MIAVTKVEELQIIGAAVLQQFDRSNIELWVGLKIFYFRVMPGTVVK